VRRGVVAGVFIVGVHYRNGGRLGDWPNAGACGLADLRHPVSADICFLFAMGTNLPAPGSR